MLIVKGPATYQRERQYILDVLLSDFLGLDYQLSAAPGEHTHIYLAEEPSGRCVSLPDVLFQTPCEDWLSVKSCPQSPLPQWTVPPEIEPCCIGRCLPIAYGTTITNAQTYWNEDSKGIQLGIDILGSAFFFLTRYEEAVHSVPRDRHNRFPAAASLAVRENFLHRPLVNEYLEILRFALQRLWPGLSTKQRTYRVFLSHDIDRPLSVRGKGPVRIAKSLVRDVFGRRDISLVTQRAQAHWKQARNDTTGSFESDPNNTFEFLMDQSEEHGLKSAFFFLSSNKGEAIDADYTLEESWLLDLYQRIHQRGHEIGLHPGYYTYLDIEKTRREFESLRQAVAKAGIEPQTWGGRQHYLRWQNPETWQNWNDAGLTYDSTLSFAERPGFRCGTCYEYPVFNLRTRQLLRLRERPLIMMEGTLLDYMSLSHEQILKEVDALSAACRRFNGDFTLLWHNDRLLGRFQKSFYSNIIQRVAG